MNKKLFLLSAVLLICFISSPVFASDPPPSGLSVSVTPDFDIYGYAQKKLNISWQRYSSWTSCCNNNIDRLLGYDLTITTLRNCSNGGGNHIHLQKDATSYTTFLQGDTNVVEVLISARLLSIECHLCSPSASYNSDSVTKVLNMATEGCGTYLSIPPDDTDTCSSKRKEVGEPINILNGEMTLEETDFKIKGINIDLEFRRSYSSRQQIPSIANGISVPVNKSAASSIFSELMEIGRKGASSPALSASYDSLTRGTPIGWGWTHNYSSHIDFLQSGNVIRFVNGKGRSSYFYKESESSANFLQSGKPSSMSFHDNGDTTYSLTYDNGKAMIFSESGALLTLISPEGNHIELEYDGSGKLVKIYDTLNRQYSLNYDSNGRITSIVEDSQTATLVSFSYDSTGRLTSVSYPDNSTAQFEYNDANDNLNITRTTARDGRVHNYIYDTADRVSSFSDDNGKHFSSLEYHPTEWYTKLTNTRGNSTFLHYESINRAGLLKNTTGNTCTTCASPFFSYTNDIFGRLTEETDSYGNTTSYENFDNAGHPQTIRYANGSSDERAVYLTYNTDTGATLSAKSESVFGNGYREIILDYDDDGNNNYNENPGNLLKNVVLKGYTRDIQKNAVPFTYTTSVSYDALSRITSLDGPRDDLSDITSFEYYAADDADTLNRNRLKSFTDALGNKYTYDNYDIYGNAGKITFPDVTFIELSYDAAGNITQVKKDSALRQYGYYPGGVLHYEKMPEGNIIEYFYNDLGDLSMAKLLKGAGLQSDILETLLYTYDAERNVTSLEIKEGDENGTTVLHEGYFYGYLNELKYVYPDASDTNIKIEMANSLLLNKFRQASLPEGEFSMEFSYDSLLRVKKITEFPQGANLATNYLYDNSDNIKSITDASGNAAEFEYDDLGRLLRVSSAQRGEKLFSYDALSFPATVKDPFSRTRQFSYDSLGRLTNINYVNENKSLTLAYDEPESSFGKGQLTSISDGNFTVRYHYDVYGNLTQEDTTTDGKSYSVIYGYDKNGRITKMDYPSGIEVLYDYADTWSYPHGVKIKKTDGTTVDVTISRGADDKIRKIVLPSGITETFGYDKQYRIDSHKIEKQGAIKIIDLDYARDVDGNVTFITDTLDASRNLSFGYDSFARITSSSGHFGNISFTYDGVGNRIKSVLNGVERNYNYVDNQLASISGDISKNYSYNSEGNLISNGSVNLTYNKDGLINSTITNNNKNISYEYDFYGKRYKKIREGNWQNYLYDLEGRLISVIDRNGNCAADFVYTGDERIGVVMPQSEASAGSYRKVKGGKTKHRKKHILLGAYKIKFKMKHGKPKLRIKKQKRKKRRKGKSFKADVEPKVTVLGVASWDGIRKILSADVEITNKTSTLDIYDVDARVTGISDASVIAFNPDGNVSGKPFWYYGKIAKGGKNIIHWEFHDPGSHSFNFTAKIMGSYSAPAEVVYFYHNDHLGRPVMMTDESGNVSWQAEYYPFGRIYSEQGTTVENNFRFPGQWYDEESGFFYNGARYYDPDNGRYLSPDPVIATPYLPQTLNPYVYVTDNPVRFVDESGRWGEDVHSGIGNKDYGTYKWAIEVGFSPSEAKRIAIADNSTDFIFSWKGWIPSFSTTSWLPFKGDQSRHFNQPNPSFHNETDSRNMWADIELDRATEFMKQGKCKVATEHLGKGLHSIQDKYAHRNWDTGFFEWSVHPKWYDDWNDPRNKTASKLTEIKTKKYLMRFIQLTR